MIVPTNPRKPAVVTAIFLLALSFLVTLLTSLTQYQFAQAAPAITLVSGPILTDTTWSLAGSPYIMTNTVTIQPSVTLTIEAGVEVQATMDTELQVQGNLLVLGTSTQPVTITSGVQNLPGEWQGIIVDSTGMVSMTHTSVSYGDTSMRLMGSNTKSVRLENVTLTQNEYGLIVATDSLHQLQMNHVSFSENVNNRVLINTDNNHSTLAGSITLKAQPGLSGYEIADDTMIFDIPDGITLTLAANTTLFSQYYNIIYVHGKMLVEGEITATTTISGFEQIAVFDSGSLTMSHALLYGGESASLDLGLAILGGDSSKPIALQGSTFSNYDMPIVISPDALHRLQMDNVNFSDNLANRVFIDAPLGNMPLASEVNLVPQSGLEGYEVLDDDLIVPSGITLTLAPGTTLIMGATGQLLIIDGHLQAIGSPNNPVTITSAISTPGATTYNMIFSGGTSHLAYATIQHGYVPVVVAELEPDAEVFIENSTIRDSFITIGSTSESIHQLRMSNVTFLNNVRNRVFIDTDSDKPLVDDVTLTSQPGLEGYEVYGYNGSFSLVVPEGITLTLEPGVSMMVEEEGVVSVEGYLQAVGAITKPITFTSILDSGPGEWSLLNIAGSAQLEWVTLRYAKEGLCIYDYNNPGLEGTVVVKNSVFRNNETVGICAKSLYPHSPDIWIEDTIILDNAGYAFLADTGTLPNLHLNNVQFQDNGFNRVLIEAHGSPLTGDTLLSSQSGLEAYEVYDMVSAANDLVVPAGISLTLDAGVMLMMPNQASVQVAGKLVSLGSFTRPITFTSAANSGPDQWPGLVIEGGVGHLQHTTVRYGESNIGLTGPDATLYLSHTQSINGVTGLAVFDGSVVADCSTFANHQADGVAVSNGGSPNVTVFSSNLFNNGGAGINNSSGALVEARNNWWGDGSGPGGIGPGTGDEISGTVAFEPWLTQPECLTAPSVTFTAPAYSVTEGTATAVLTLTLSFAPLTTAPVNYATWPGTAVPGSDYLTSSGTLTFTPGMTTAVIPITILDDDELEPDETLMVGLSSPQNLLLGIPATVTLTILDNDPALADLGVLLMASNNSIPVGGGLTYTVTINNNGPQTATAVTLTNELPPEVTLVTSPPNCTGTTTLTCLLGSLSPNSPITLTYQVKADGILSGVITNSVVIAAAELDALPANNEATVTTHVLAPLVAFDSSAYSVSEGEGVAVLTVILDFAPVSTVTVGYAVLAGTAEAGSDYLPVSGTLAFLPGSMVQTVIIPVVDDGLVEGNETVQVVLGPAINALLENATATLTILDNDQLKLYRLYLPFVNKP